MPTGSLWLMSVCSKRSKQTLWKLFDENISSPKQRNKHPEHCKHIKNQTNGLSIIQSREDHCHLCESILIVSELGFHICKNKDCAVMHKNILDTTAEWRYYGSDDNQFNSDPTRCGMPINPLLQQSSYGCTVNIIGSTSYEMRKIKKYTEWQSMPYKEKTRYDDFQTINTMATNAGIPKLIIEDAMYYHKHLSDIKRYRGINREGIIAASIYISCRVNDYPRTAKEIASIFMLDNSSTTRGCKNASNLMNELELNTPYEDKVKLCDTTPVVFIERFCSKLNINYELTMLCKFIALNVDSMNLIPENTPHSIATGIIYFVINVCKLNISKKEIYKISDISEVTINKCFKKLAKHTSMLIPKMILSKYCPS